MRCTWRLGLLHLLRAHEPGGHHLAGLAHGRAEHVGDVGEDVGVHTGVHHVGGKAVAHGLNADLGHIVAHRLAAGGHADAEQPPQLVLGEGPQLGEPDHRAELLPEEQGDDDDAHQAAQAAGDGRAGDAQCGQGDPTPLMRM